MNRNVVASPSTNGQVREQGHRGASRSKNRIRRSTSKPLRVPPGKIAQAEALLMQGRSQREIGRALHISPMTVAKIMKAEDFQAAITEARQLLFSQLPAVVNCVIRGAINDPYLGYSLLKDIGIIAKYDSFIVPEKPAPSTEEERQQRQIHVLAAVIQERHRVFGIELPDDMAAAIEEDEAAHPDEAENKD